MCLLLSTYKFIIMRDIKFRGLTKKTSTMIQGYLVKHWERAYIAWGAINDKPTLTEVNPETVGEYTGLKDKYYIDVFEGDVVALDDLIIPITFSNGSFQMVSSEKQGISAATQERLKRFEIIGNVHENPELLT